MPPPPKITEPCVRCVHAQVCSIRPKLTAIDWEEYLPPRPDPAFTFVLTAEVRCAHFLAKAGAEPDAPSLVRPPTHGISEETRRRMREGQQRRHARLEAERTQEALAHRRQIQQERTAALAEADPAAELPEMASVG